MDKLRSYIEGLKIIDTHEHFMEMSGVLRRNLDLFGLIGYAYVSGDLYCAGADHKMLFVSSAASEKKWNELRKFLPAVKTLSYYRYMDDAFKNLYGFKAGLTDSTWKDLNKKIISLRQDRVWYTKVVTEKCKIEYSMLDRYWKPLISGTDYKFLKPIFRINIYVMGSHGDKDGDGNRLFETYPELEGKLKTLDAYLGFIEGCVLKAKRLGYAGLKSALAYDRTLYYEDVPEKEAARIFKLERKKMTAQEKKKLEDFLFHCFMKLAVKHDMPVQIHTGMHADFNNSIIDNSDPGKLNNIFMKYKDLRLDIFHTGYPFHSKLIALVKNFRNVNFDLCWMPIISPFMAGQILNEALDMLPNSKIFWGGDCKHPEEAFGAVRMGKDVVCEVLSSRIDKGIMDLDTAKMVAKNIFHDNAKKFYGI